MAGGVLAERTALRVDDPLAAQAVARVGDPRTVPVRGHLRGGLAVPVVVVDGLAGTVCVRVADLLLGDGVVVAAVGVGHPLAHHARDIGAGTRVHDAGLDLLPVVAHRHAQRRVGLGQSQQPTAVGVGHARHGREGGTLGLRTVSSGQGRRGDQEEEGDLLHH